MFSAVLIIWISLVLIKYHPALMKVSSALTFCQLGADEGQLGSDKMSTQCWCRSARFWQNVNPVLTKDQPCSDKMSTWRWQKISPALTKCQPGADKWSALLWQNVNPALTKDQPSSDNNVNPVLIKGQLSSDLQSAISSALTFCQLRCWLLIPIKNFPSFSRIFFY